jgi:U3 small nucleolar RNA-associated protein 12
VESEKGAERLMEALELYRTYKEELADAEAEAAAAGKTAVAPALPPLMMAYQATSPDDYIAKMVEAIKASELEQTLLVLPLDVVVHLLEVMEVLLRQCRSTETVCRTFFFLVEIHFGPLSSSKHLAPLIKRVRDLASDRVTEAKDTVGFNVAALQYHMHRKKEESQAFDMIEATMKVKDKRKKKRNKQKALQTAILTL